MSSLFILVALFTLTTAGKRYTYNYDVKTSTALLATLQDHADIHITATANIDVVSPCEYILRLTEVQLEGSTHTQEFGEGVTKSPLRFSFQDGQVEALCSEVSEPAWVLNFKRGVLSTFQSSMTRPGHQDLQETDISGTCITHYKSTMEGDVMTIDKVKDLSSCTHRPDLSTYITGTAYMSDSAIQSLPIFNSTNNCHQIIQQGILNTAECHESHKFRPFSSEEGGAITTVQTKLVLVSSDQPAVPTTNSEFILKSAVFEETSRITSEAQVEVVQQILVDLNEAAHGEIRPSVPVLFSNLVASLKPLDYPTLVDLFSQTEEKHSQRFLIDAMPLVQTAAAMGLVKDMYINGDMTPTEADIWFTSLAFFKNPTSDMFTVIAPLVDLEIPRQQALLGASALVNTYCKLHSQCEADAGVQQVLRAIEKHVGSSCRIINTPEHSNKMLILTALKALGNAGHWVNANEVLRQCYTEENDMEVRVAAIEAWRHTPCEYDRSHLLAAFQDEAQDTEVRIAAYLAVMTCPTENVLNTIKDRLTSEAVNQVGSFVWTHLTNMQESAAPGKQWFRQIIGEELLHNKFNTNALKYSRNFEKSFFTNELNAGASVDSNVIFSSKSYLPRSAMFNLTLDLFGESVNLFEVGGHIQGFESYIEHFFGPAGILPIATMESLLTNMRRNKPNEATTLEDFIDRPFEEAEGTYYLRVLGKELYLNHFHDLKDILPTSNPVDLILEMVRQGDIDYTKSFQLIDSSYSIPTVSGFPVTLNAKGTATLALRMNGNLNANSLTNFNIEGHLHPSAAIHMDGVMMVDAHVTRKGLQISSTLHTSTFIDGKIHINGGKLVDVAINTPKEKMEVIDVDTKFFILEDDVLLEKNVDNQIHSESCTESIMGGHLCGQLAYTSMSTNSPYFPLSGPFSAKIYLEKTDTHTGYIFHYAYAPQQVNIQFDTPGSQVDRRVSLNVGLDQQTLNIDMYTPFKTFQGVGQYIWQDNDRHLKVEVTVDSGEKYTLDTGVNIVHDGGIQIQPTLILTSSQGQIINIDGSFGGQLTPQPFLSTQLNIEYGLPGSDTHTIHYSFNIKKDITPDMATYSVHFDLMPSQLPNMALGLDYNFILSLGHVETHAKLSYATITWQLDQSLNYYNEVDHKGIDLHGSIKCPAKNIDYAVSQKVEVVSNMLKMESLLHLYDNNEYGIQMVFTEIEDGHYKAQVIGSVSADKYELDADLLNTSVSGKISAILQSTLKSARQNIAFNGKIYGDIEKANVDLSMIVNDQQYIIRVAGTRTSIMVETNIYTHMLLNTYVTSSEDINKLHLSVQWDKDVDPTKALIIDGQVSPVEIIAALKVLDQEFSASGKVVTDGVEMMAKWAPDQSVVTKVLYSLEDTKSVEVIVETPFPGWEKQDVSVTLSATENNLNARAVANWKNSEQMSLTISANLQPGFPENALSANILFSSTLNALERLTFTLDHKMTTATINTNMEATWNDKKINGVINVTPSDNGIDASASFTSPFTQEALITLHHELNGNQLSTLLEAKYGTYVSNITLAGHITLDQTHDVLLTLKVFTPLPFIPEMEANLKYTLDTTILAVVVEGNIGDNKIMLNINGEKTVNDNTTSITGDIRFITPFTIPLTATLSHSQDGHQFTSQLIMTGSIKVHLDGHYLSENDVLFNAFLSSPMVKSSITLNHKIQDTTMKSGFEVSVNRERIGASINGVVDKTNTLANLQMEVISTFRGLTDIKVNLDTKKEGNTWISNVIISKDSLSVNIDHSITFSDYLNWENIFLINNVYQLRNKLTHSDTSYTLDMETWIDGEQMVHITTSVEPKISADISEVNAHLIIVSAWNDPFKVDLYYQHNGVEFKPTLSIEYIPGQIIQLASVYRLESSVLHIESTLTTPFWQPLAYKVNISWDTVNIISIELTRGNNRSLLTLTTKYDTLSKMEAKMEMTSTYLPQPVLLEGSYDFMSAEKSVFVALTTDQTYSITAAISGEVRNGQLRLLSVLPIPNAEHILLHTEYNINTMPITTKIELEVNSKKYEADIIINPNAIQLNMDLEGEKGLVATHWDYQDNQANIDINFESPVDSIGDMKLHAMYDITNEKKLNININEGVAQFNFVANMEDALAPEFMLDIVTPLSVIQVVQAKVHWDVKNPVKTVQVSGLFNDNNYNWQLDISADSLLKGNVVSKMSSSIPGWTLLNIEIHYDFTTTPSKTTFIYNKEEVTHKLEALLTLTLDDFHGEIITSIPGWEQLTFNGTYSFEDMHLIGKLEVHQGDAIYSLNSDIIFSQQPKIEIHIHTPFTFAANIDLLFKIMKTQTDSQYTVSVTRNDHTYQVDLILHQIHKAGHFELKMMSPIPALTNINILGKYDFTDDVKRGNVELSLPNDILLTINVGINNNNVILDITTPYEGYNTIKMMGDYIVSNQQHTIMATLDTNNLKYDFHFDLSLINKELSMTFASPIELMKLVKVYGKFDVLDYGVDSTLQVQRNEDIITLKVLGNFTPLKSQVHMNIETPVIGWNVFSLGAKYDLLSDKKMVALTFQKNDDVKILKLEVEYSMQKGYFKLQTPIVDFEVLGVEYTMNIDTSNHNMEIIQKVIHNNNEWNFTFKAQYTDTSVYFDLTTPFEMINTISVSLEYNWDESRKDSTMHITYNQYNFVLSTSVNISLAKSELSVQMSTPIVNYENLSLVVKYDINNRESLVSAYINIDQQVYNLLISGFIENKLVHFKCHLTSPITEWSDIKLETNIDLTGADTIVEIVLIREGSIKLIDIHARLIGTALDINMTTPFDNLPDLSFLGVLDRNKRSLEMNMMNDLGEVSLFANFHSVKIHLKTPFERAQEIVWELTKVGEGVYNIEWRRNDNYAIISVERQGRSNAFNVEIRSELHGWELLSLAGALDEETLEAYLSGAINEDKIIVTSSATFGATGSMHLHIETPFERFRAMNVDFNYDIKQGKAKWEASSSSSTFHFLLDLSPVEGIHGLIIVPNTVKDTQVSVNIGLYSGKIAITSRFPAVRDFLYEHNIQTGPVTTITSIVQLNNNELFKLNASATSTEAGESKVHVQMKIHNIDGEMTILYHHPSSLSMTVSMKHRESPGNEFRVEITGSGNLPSQGLLDIVIDNSFSQTPVTVTAHTDFDMTQERKQVSLHLKPTPSQMYKFDVDFGYGDKVGDFDLKITTPDRRMSPWKHITGNFNILNLNDVHFEVTYGGTLYTLQGKLDLFESNLKLTPGPQQESILLQWTILSKEYDYFIKVGPESQYSMISLDGTFSDIGHVTMRGGFKVGYIMDDEVHYTLVWDLVSSGALTSEGTFNYGPQYKGNYRQEFHHNYDTHTAQFMFGFTSNIVGMRSFSMNGNYDFDQKVVIHGIIQLEDQEAARIDINFTDISLDYSHSTVEYVMPFLPAEFRSLLLTFDHDFKDATRKSISVLANISGIEHSFNTLWSHSEPFDVLNAEINIVSTHIGEIRIAANFDLSNIDDARAEIHYVRDILNEKREMSLRMSRKMTEQHLESEILFESTLQILSHVRLFVNADFSDVFNLSSGLEWNNKSINFVFDINQDSIAALLTTPFRNFEKVEAKCTYSLSGNIKKVTFIYERGTNKVEMDVTLNVKSKRKGNLNFTLTTPFEILKLLHIDATWHRNKAEVNIKRNDYEYKMNGNIELHIDNSSFDVSITVPGWEVIRIAASYNVQDFLSGTLTDNQKIAGLELQFEGHTIILNVNGFSNAQNINLEFVGRTSFEFIKTCHLKLTTKSSDQSREGIIKVHVNDFEFKTTNQYEKRGQDGFYIKSKVETTLIPLPALIVGIGRNGDETAVTIGYGDDREITFSIQGKDNFRSGFSGFVDIPNFGPEVITYDLGYGFHDDNNVFVKVDIELGRGGQKIEAEFLYDSDDVRAFLTSPLTGIRSLRFRRSVSSEGVVAEAGINDYNIHLRGSFKEGDFRRGALLDVDVLGYKLLFDLLIQSEGLQYTEGKLIIQTPFPGLENIGGLITLSIQDNVISGQAEIIPPFFIEPLIKIHLQLDMNQKMNGHLTLDIAGEKFLFNINLMGESLTEGYQGTFEIHTPIPMISDIIFDISLKIVDGSSVQVSVGINDKRVTAHYIMNESTFKFNLDTNIASVHRQFSVEANYPSLDNLKGAVIFVLGEQIHDISIEMNILENRVQGTVKLQSSLIEGERNVTFDISIPSSSLRHIIFNVTLSTSQSHSLYLDVNTEPGIVAAFRVDSPLVPGFTVNLLVEEGIASLALNTVDAQHKINLKWQMTQQYHVTVEVMSPLFSPITMSLFFNGNYTDMLAKVYLRVDDHEHIIETMLHIDDNNNVQFSISLETPFRNINRWTLDVVFTMSDDIIFTINAITTDQVNNLYAIYDKVNARFMLTVNSPFLPEGQVSLEAIITGNMEPNLKLKLEGIYASQTLSGVLILKTPSVNNMMAAVKLTTPFRGYKKMNFMARYKKEEMTTILITVDRPIQIKIELQLNNTPDKIMVNINLETSLEELESVEAKMEMPLNMFSPNVNVKVISVGVPYSGHIQLRTKAPYELGWGYKIGEHISEGFHFKTDSLLL
ncbi:hypothetical protein Pmani_032941 [Petrolisthes manimaculis]|uniref:Vitellogenin domain-containing protein n=1 Tax=Petrolisthes manimaculis TaxID=1843537 RepID=A0AAE1NQQ2_9EUCA|nr:hypothetical protein Pmani_032941 [Petrolisthes manimaculis]